MASTLALALKAIKPSEPEKSSAPSDDDDLSDLDQILDDYDSAKDRRGRARALRAFIERSKH